jgi:hypothetical protein
MTVAGLCLAVTGLATPAHAGGVCLEFLDQAEFEDYCMQHGKLLKGIETFEESNVPDGAGSKVTLPAPLQGNVPNVDPDTLLGFPDGLTEKNLIIQDNVFPGPNPPFPDPSGSSVALFVLGTGPPYNVNSKKVGEDMFIEDPPVWASLDLIFTDPYHTGVGFELSRFEGYALAGWHISVYNMAGVEIAKFFVPPPPAPEPTKFFWGVWCDEGIGRINIWDEAGPEPDAIDNIQMWMEPGQPPACPGDCSIPPDKVVNIIDFLTLLAQWGGPGSCDLDGNGVVNINDFLLMLAFWGPCPAPANDECFAPEPIDKTDPEGLTIAHFDMWGATPSPEPYKCLSEPPIHKDIWYCLTNVTTETIGVTITTNIPLFIEVNDGCQCPPGPLIACGEGPVGTNQFVLVPGQQALIRLIDWFDLPNDQLKGSMFLQNKIIGPDGVNFFEDPFLFEEELAAQGKFLKAIWAFKPDHLPTGAIVPVDDVLDIFTHPVNAPGVWDDGSVNFWPPEVDNVQFSSNLNPQGPWDPGGQGAMAYLKPGSVPDIFNNALTSFLFQGSFDIISGPPAGDNHTAMLLELVSWDENGIDDPVEMHVSVYDKNDVEIGKYLLTGFQPFGKRFLGIITKDPTITIGRVDIWDEWCSYEGISTIGLYLQGEPEPVNFYTDRDLFYQAINDAGKIDKFWWDFAPHNNSSIIPLLSDFLDIFSHGLNFDDPWTDAGGNDLWPPWVDNVQFASNATPQGPLTPAGGMVFLHPGSWPINNNALVEAFFDPSFDIISGPPAGANHTAFAMDLISIDGPLPTQILVSVYDKNDAVIGEFLVDYFGDKAFLGVLTKDPAITIGRIDIWDVNHGAEGVSFIQAFWQMPGGDNECSPPGVCGTHQQCGTGSPFNCFCFEVDFDPAVGMCIQDFLCAGLQPCPAGNPCPPGFVCVTNSCCVDPVCAPIVKCDQLAAPIPPDASGPTAAGNWIDPKD